MREFGIFFIVLLYFGSFKGGGEEEVEGGEVGEVSWCLVAGEIRLLCDFLFFLLFFF